MAFSLEEAPYSPPPYQCYCGEWEEHGILHFRPMNSINSNIGTPKVFNRVYPVFHRLPLYLGFPCVWGQKIPGARASVMKFSRQEHTALRNSTLLPSEVESLTHELVLSEAGIIFFANGVGTTTRNKMHDSAAEILERRKCNENRFSSMGKR